jgi:hypothetical protein
MTPEELTRRLERWRALILDGTPLAAVREIEIELAKLKPAKK